MPRTPYKRPAGDALPSSRSKRVRFLTPSGISFTKEEPLTLHAPPRRSRTPPRDADAPSRKRVKREPERGTPKEELEKVHQVDKPSHRIKPIPRIPRRKRTVLGRLALSGNTPKKNLQSIDTLFWKQGNRSRLDSGHEESPGPPWRKDLGQNDPRQGLPSIDPLLWTQEYLQLLGCGFTAKKIMPNDRFDPHWWLAVAVESPVAAYKSNQEFLGRLEPQSRFRTMVEKLVSDEFISLRDPRADRSTIFDSALKFNLSLRFGNKRAATIPANAVFSHPNLGKSLPFLAIIDLSETHARRNVLVAEYVIPDQKLVDFYQKQESHLGSSCEGEDPYILAVLIALAQAQRNNLKEEKKAWSVSRKPSRGRTDSPSPCIAADWSKAKPKRPNSSVCRVDEAKTGRRTENCFKVRLVALSENGKKAFYYEASIPSEFLGIFDAPSQAPPSRPVSVFYYQMPIMNKSQIWDVLCRVSSEANESRSRASTSK